MALLSTLDKTEVTCLGTTHRLSAVSPHVVGAQLYRLSTVDAHTDVLKAIHGKII